MNISKFSIKRPVTSMMIIFSMTVIGAIVLLNLKTQLMPNYNIPYASISAKWTGASPDDMEKLVTKKIEEALVSVEGIKSISTDSSQGSSSVFVEFNFGVDIDAKTNDLVTAMNTIKSSLPSDLTVEPTVRKSIMGLDNVITFSLIGSDLLNNKIFADNIIVPRLEKLEGVGSVEVSGGAKRRISVYIDPNKLESYNLSILDLYSVLKRANINFPAGTIKEGDKQYLVRFFGELKTFEDVQDIVIANRNGQTLLLRDVANIKLDTVDQESYGRADGVENVIIQVQKTDTGNTVNISKEVQSQLKSIEPLLPAGAKFIINNDTAIDINNSINAVKNNAFVGLLLASLTLFFFLKDWRATLVVSIAIPVSIMAAFGFFGAKGMTLNVVSLMGLSLGVGMLVDNSIVVLDNIFRHLTELKEDNITAAELGASEVVVPVITSTATTISVFMPVVIQNGFLKEAFKDMSYSITFSLLASLIIALTFVPMISSKVLKSHKMKIHEDGKFLLFMREKYSILLGKALRHRLITILAVIVSFLVIVVGGSRFTGGQLQPKSDDGKYTVVAELPSGMDVAKALRISEKFEKAVSENPYTKKYVTRIRSDSITVNVDIGYKSERKPKVAIKTVVDSVRKSIGETPDVKLNIREGNQRGGHGSSRDFEIVFKSDNAQQLEYITRLVSDKMAQAGGFVDITNSLISGVPEARLVIDRKKLEYLGVSTSDLGMGVSYQILGGSPITIKTDKEELDVTLLLDSKYRTSIDLLMDSRIKTSSGTVLKLKDVATLEIAEGAKSITKKDKIRTADITANFSGGLDLTAGQEKAKQIIADIGGLPRTVTYEFGGDSEMLAEVLKQALTAFAVALFLIYFILAAQFESYALPFIVMGTVPFAVIGVFGGLLITGQKTDMMVYVGIIMLAGIVVNNAIILIDFIQELIAKGVELNEALLTAGKIRLRPILMTTLTTIFGMLPLAFGIGQGSEMYKGMAITVIFGLAFSTLLTLVVIPVLFTFYHHTIEKIKARQARRDAESL
ncbi:MAG: efflux RND transporter permease subunit [Fusobacteriaceae bacterium]